MLGTRANGSGWRESSNPRVGSIPWIRGQPTLGASRIFFDCRRQGVTLRSTIDCLIAQLVLEIDAVLLHDDIDFERIKSVRPLRTWQG